MGYTVAIHMYKKFNSHKYLQERLFYSSTPCPQKEITHGGMKVNRHSGVFQKPMGSNISKLEGGKVQRKSVG